MSWQREHYTVGWICAIEIEYAVACEMLDEEYTKDKAPKIDISQDPNIYTFGSIHEHAVVVACLPRGRYGINAAAVAAERMRRSFPAIRFGLLVGIAGGAPTDKHDIRLGDIVVSSPTPRHGGVIQYDFGKAVQHQEFEETGHLASPPEVLLNALNHLAMQHTRRGHIIGQTIMAMAKKNPRLMKCVPSKVHMDRLCAPSYVHKDHGCDCQNSDIRSAVLRDHSKLNFVLRPPRVKDLGDPVIHYGLIASANQLMKNASVRDALSYKYEVLCFETEAAGLMNSFPSVVIRGICDYSDTHKNDLWQAYAAASAAAYAKELLSIVPAKPSENMGIIKTEPNLGSDDREGWMSKFWARRTRPSIGTLSNKDHRRTTQHCDDQPYGYPTEISAKAMTSPYGTYRCKTCDEVFADSSSLKIHMDSHAGDKSFICEVPIRGRQFSEAPALLQHRTRYGTILNESLESERDEALSQTSPGHIAQESPISRNLSSSGFPGSASQPTAALAWCGANDSNDDRFQRQYYAASPPSFTRTSTEIIEYNNNGKISKHTFSQTSSQSSYNSMNKFRNPSWSDAKSSQRTRSPESTINSRIHTQSEIETLPDSLSHENTTNRTSLTQSFGQERKTEFENNTSGPTQKTDIASHTAENSMPHESTFDEDFEILEQILDIPELKALEQVRLKFRDTVRRLRTKVDALSEPNNPQQSYIERPIQDQRERQYECLSCDEQFESKDEMERHQMLHLNDQSYSSRYDYFQKYGHFPD